MPDTTAEYPSRYEGLITLKDGRTVFTRPILNTDESLLAGLFEKLSPQSRYQRFLITLKSLSEEMLHHFTHVDYDSHCAIVAVIEEEGKDAFIAVARYAYDPIEKITDLGVAVRDDWQQFGLGKKLLRRIIQIGKDHGVSRFVAVADPQNLAIRHIFSVLGYDAEFVSRGGYLHILISA
jgi:RimJ/RimL family protein N-acetyltransferase